MPNLSIDLKMKELLILRSGFWKDLSVAIRLLIYKDMLKGVLQGKQDTYRSKGYVYLKNRWMIIGGEEKLTKSGKVSKKIVGGKKVYPYEGVSIKSNWTKSVNMLLTGQTIDGLEYEKSTPTSVTLSYKAKDRKKIFFNEVFYNRDIRTLSDTNQNKVVKLIEDELVKNISDWYKDKIIITIGA